MERREELCKERKGNMQRTGWVRWHGQDQSQEAGKGGPRELGHGLELDCGACSQHISIHPGSAKTADVNDLWIFKRPPCIATDHILIIEISCRAGSRSL